MAEVADIRIEVEGGETRVFDLEDITNTLWLLGQLGDGRLLFPEQSAKRGQEVADGSRLIAGTYKFSPRAAGEILQRVKTLCRVHAHIPHT